MTPVADRARRVDLANVHPLLRPRIQAQFEAELAAAVAETVAACAAGVRMAWCWYCGTPIVIGPAKVGGRRADTRYCTHACQIAASRPKPL